MIAEVVLKVKNVIKAGHDIVNPKWIVDCVAKAKLLPLTSKYYTYMSPETRERLEDLSSGDEVQAAEGAGSSSTSARAPQQAGPAESESDELDVPPIKRSKDAKGKAVGTSGAIERDDSATEDDEDEQASTASDSDHPDAPSGKVRDLASLHLISGFPCSSIAERKKSHWHRYFSLCTE